MGWRGTTLLAAIVLIASLLVYRDVLRENPEATLAWLLVEAKPTPPSADIERVLDFDASRVVALRIESDKVQLRVRRDAGGWSQVRDGRAVDQYLASLAQLAVIRRIETPATGTELSQFGLAPPRGVIEVTLDSGRALRLLLGDHNPTSTGIYARLGNNGPIVVTGALASWELKKLSNALLPQAIGD